MMKLIFLLLTTLTFAANEPVYIKGQADATALKFRDLQAPNKQITKTGTENFLVETGNQNLLENPSFEHPTVGFGWTDASTNTKSAETTVVIHGKKALKIELSANDVNLTQESTLYASQFGGTTQGMASIRIKTDVLVRICTVEAGIVSTTNCLNSSLDNQWHIYKIPFVLGATSNGINLFVDSGTGTVYLDDAFVGAMEVTAVTDASRIAGEAVFAPTSSCIWFRSNAVIGAFSSTSACPGPTIIKEYVGDWQTTDANLPQITINALPAGVYKATFYVPLYSGAAAQNSLAINDGTTTCNAVNVHSNTDSGQGVVSCTFEYGTAGNRTFSLYGASSTSLINIENNTSGSATRGTKFQLEYYTSFSTYSSANADTDWVPCSFSTLAWQGLGTVDASLLKCKRQGSDLLMSGLLTVGTTTASEARLQLPIWNGTQLIVKSGVFQPSGRMLRASTTANVVKDYSVTSTGGDSYLNISYPEYSATFNPNVAQVGNQLFTTGATVNLENIRIPIEGWQNSNIIIAELNGLQKCASTLDCTDTFSATVDSAGNVSNENVNWLNGNATKTTGIYTFTPVTSLTTLPMNCVVTETAIQTVSRVFAIRSVSSTSIVVGVKSAADGQTLVDNSFNLICQKQGADYVGKTAKAVASDQNLRIPGVTKSVTYVEEVECDATSSLVRSLSGTSIFQTLGNISSGNCSFTLKSGLFTGEPYCTTTYTAASGTSVVFSPVFTTATTGTIACRSGTSVCSGGGPFVISCTGVSP